jgi:hypothetical protein
MTGFIEHAAVSGGVVGRPAMRIIEESTNFDPEEELFEWWANLDGKKIAIIG